MLGCMVYTEHAPRQRQFYGAPTIKNQNQEEEGGGFIWRLSVHVTVHVYCVCVSDAWATLEKKKGGKTQRKQSWNELFMIVRLTAVSQFVHDVLSVCFRCLSCFGERERKKTETITKEGIWLWNLSACISDANLPELALKDHLKKEVIRQSSFKAASQGRIAAWVLDTAGFEQCNKSRFLSTQPDTAGFKQCSKSRFLSAQPNTACEQE